MLQCFSLRSEINLILSVLRFFFFANKLITKQKFFKLRIIQDLIKSENKWLLRES